MKKPQKSQDPTVFPRPTNWLVWVPLMFGVGFCLQYLRSNVGLAFSWLAVGGGLAYFGHLYGTDRVRAYRVFEEYQQFKETLSREEALELLREAQGHFPQNAIRWELLGLLLSGRDYRSAFHILESFPLEKLPVPQRWEMVTRRAEVLLELGHLERAEYVISKLLQDKEDYLPAVKLTKRLEELRRQPSRQADEDKKAA